MQLLTMILLVISSLVVITYGRTLNSPDQLMPLIFSSVNTDENGIIPSSNGKNRLIVVIEQIIKWVFLLNILNLIYIYIYI